MYRLHVASYSLWGVGDCSSFALRSLFHRSATGLFHIPSRGASSTASLKDQCLISGYFYSFCYTYYERIIFVFSSLSYFGVSPCIWMVGATDWPFSSLPNFFLTGEFDALLYLLQLFRAMDQPTTPGTPLVAVNRPERLE